MYYYTEEDDRHFAAELAAKERESAEKKQIIALLQKIHWLETHQNDLLETERKRHKRLIKSAVTEAIKEFANLLIDKSRDGIIFVCDITDYVIEFTTKTESEENNNA